MFVAVLGLLFLHIGAGAPGDIVADPTAAQQCLPTLEGRVDRSNTTVLLSFGGWTTQDILNYIASILLREYLGYSVKLVKPSGTAKDVLPDIADRKLYHVEIESWVSHTAEYYVQYVKEEGRVTDYGPIGFDGKNGMFVTNAQTLRRQNRFALLYQFYQSASDAASMGLPLYSSTEAQALQVALTAGDNFPVCKPSEFDWCGTGGVENFWMPPRCEASPSQCLLFVMNKPQWATGKAEQLTRNLGLQAVHGYYNGELESYVQQRLDQGLPTVFYHWRPDPLLSKISAEALDFPDYFPGCDSGDNGDPNTGTRACSFKESRLWKAGSAELREIMPEASYFLKKFEVLLPDMEAMLSSTLAGGGQLSSSEVACEWIRNQTGSQDNKVKVFVPDCIAKPAAKPVSGDIVFDAFLNECAEYRAMRSVPSPISCFSTPPSENDRSDVAIRVASWNWQSNDLSNRLAEIILKDFLGYTVLRVEAHETGSTKLWWDYIPSGFYDFDAECWQAGAGTPNRVKYIEQDKVVEDFGSIGYSGRSGMLTFEFVTQRNKFSSYYSFFENATDAIEVGFPRFGDVDAKSRLGEGFSSACSASWCGTGELEGSWAPPACQANPSECVDAYMGRTAWDEAYFEQLTRNLNLKMVHTYLGGELHAVLKERYEQQQPTIFYWYEPSTLFVEFKLTRISYPEFSFGCTFEDNQDANTGGVACDYPLTTISKIGNAELRTIAPEAYYFMRNYFVHKSDLLGLMQYTVDGDGMTTDEAACAWAQANVEKINSYAPDCLTKIPNVRAGDSVFDASRMVCEKVGCPKSQWIRIRGGKYVECESCPQGEIPSEDQLSCTRCREGSRVSDDGTHCAECPVGRFQNMDGKTECKACPIGEYNDAVGLTSCQVCPPGTYFREGNGTWCHNCTAGRFTGEARMTECTNCSLGLYNDHEGATACAYCPKGTFGDKVGTAQCTFCDGIKVTDSRGMTSAEDCVCPEGSYLPLHSASCEECKYGMSCPFGASMAHYEGLQRDGFPDDPWRPIPLLDEGLYSSMDEPLVVYACQSSTRCPGGRPGTCGPNLQGLACQHCDDGFVWNGDNCTACTALERSPLVFPTLPILALPLVAAFQYRGSGDPYEKWGSAKAGFSSIWFVVLNHYQVISILSQANVMAPQHVSGLWEIYRVSSDWTRIFKLECVGFQTFTSRLLVKAVLPGVVLIGFFFTWSASQLLGAAGFRRFVMERDRTLNGFFSLVFDFFAGIVEVTFEIFKCAPNPNGSTSLTADRSIICGSDEWKGNLGINICAVALWCVGFGGLFIHAIIIAPKHFDEPAVQTRWQFLFEKYREDVYWWALVVVFKGVLLNVGFVFLITGTGQMLWLMLMLMMYGGLSSMYRPWRHIAVNFVDCWSHVCLVFGCGILCWFARNSMQDTARLEDELGQLLFISSFMCLAVVPMVGGYILWRDARRKRNAREQDIDNLVWTLRKVVESDQAAFVDCMRKSSEWDFLFITQAYKVISTEYLKIHMRPGTSAQAGSAGAEVLGFEKHRMSAAGVLPRRQGTAEAFTKRLTAASSDFFQFARSLSRGFSSARARDSQAPDAEVEAQGQEETTTEFPSERYCPGPAMPERNIPDSEEGASVQSPRRSPRKFAGHAEQEAPLDEPVTDADECAMAPEELQEALQTQVLTMDADREELDKLKAAFMRQFGSNAEAAVEPKDAQKDSLQCMSAADGFQISQPVNALVEECPHQVSSKMQHDSCQAIVTPELTATVQSQMPYQSCAVQETGTQGDVIEMQSAAATEPASVSETFAVPAKVPNATTQMDMAYPSFGLREWGSSEDATQSRAFPGTDSNPLPDYIGVATKIPNPTRQMDTSFPVLAPRRRQDLNDPAETQAENTDAPQLPGPSCIPPQTSGRVRLPILEMDIPVNPDLQPLSFSRVSEVEQPSEPFSQSVPQCAGRDRAMMTAKKVRIQEPGHAAVPPVLPPRPPRERSKNAKRDKKTQAPTDMVAWFREETTKIETRIRSRDKVSSV